MQDHRAGELFSDIEDKRAECAQGALYIRKCLLWHFRKFVNTVGCDEFVAING